MKKILILFLMLISGLSNSQSNDYNGFMKEIYLFRQPSPKAEALGTGLAANTDASFGPYYNPALTGLNTGVQFDFSVSSPYYNNKQSSYKYFGTQYTAATMGTFGLSYYSWVNSEHVYDSEQYINDPNTQAAFNNGAGSSILALNYSREIVKDFFAGINGSLVHFNPGSPSISFGQDIESGSSFTVDFGLLKVFPLKGSAGSNHQNSIRLGVSLYNITRTKLAYIYDEKITEELPQILRFAISHNLIIKEGIQNNSSNIFELLSHVEYQDVLNSRYNDVFKVGEELIIKDILILRAGYYNYKPYTDMYRTSGANRYEFTYGAGLKIPLNLIFKTENSIVLKIDYVNLPQHSYGEDYKWKNFNSFSMNVNYIP